VPIMQANGGGHILICSSTVSEIGLPMYGMYTATKSAQDSIAGALRAELAGYNIHVSTVHPIGTRTEFFDVVRSVSPLKQVPCGSDHQPDKLLNTPASLTHSAENVARAVLHCLRNPRPEVWPSTAVRFGIALTTAVPRLGAWSMSNLMRRRFNTPYNGNGRSDEELES